MPWSILSCNQPIRVCAFSLASLFLPPLADLSLSPQAWASDAEIDTIAYVKNHCVRCHGAEEQNADRRFDTERSSVIRISRIGPKATMAIKPEPRWVSFQ